MTAAKNQFIAEAPDCTKLRTLSGNNSGTMSQGIGPAPTPKNKRKQKIAMMGIEEEISQVIDDHIKRSATAIPQYETIERRLRPITSIKLVATRQEMTCAKEARKEEVFGLSETLEFVKIVVKLV